jgi:hypothetical protein
MKICGSDIIVQGGLIRTARIDGEKYEFPTDPEAMLDGLRKSGIRIDLFTFLQKVPDTAPKYSYLMEWDNLAVLPVTTFDHWWTEQIRSYPRNRARQAEKKGVVLREVPLNEDLLQGICAIYNECPVRQGRRFPHYGMTVERARGYAGTFVDRSIWIGAFLDGTLIGFVKLVTDKHRTLACLVHILSMAAHKDKAPTNALIARAVKSCADRGISHLIYENFNYGKKRGDSLSHFKEVNGFQRVDVPRYYVPLTPMGWATYRLGFHHRLIERIPESIAGRLRTWRKSFYERKFQLETKA